MVQLKVSSVKRHKHFSVISIPYGSIKSTDAAGRIARNNRFQFLMVQLKVFTKTKEQIIQYNFNSLWFN